MSGDPQSKEPVGLSATVAKSARHEPYLHERVRRSYAQHLGINRTGPGSGVDGGPVAVPVNPLWKRDTNEQIRTKIRTCDYLFV